MTGAAGPYLAGCVLLAVAGVAKVREPQATRRALAGFPGRGASIPSWAVRAGGVAEVALGVTALATGAPGPALVVTLCYLAFAGFVTASLARGRGARCGCFGEAAGDIAVGPLHAAVDVVLAAAALAVASTGGLHAPPLERAAMYPLAAGLAWVIYLVLVPLPRLMAAVRGTGP